MLVATRAKPPSSKSRNRHVLYKDRRFIVTTADVRTRTAYYPVVDTVGRVRRDILLSALLFSAVVGLGLWRYYDLWLPLERQIMFGVIILSLIIGSQVSILQLDARGFPARHYFARSSTVRKLLNAITQARALAVQSQSGYEPEDSEGEG